MSVIKQAKIIKTRFQQRNPSCHNKFATVRTHTVEPVLAECALQHGAGHAASTHAVLGICLVLLLLHVLYSQLSHHLHLQLLGNLVGGHLVADSGRGCYKRSVKRSSPPSLWFKQCTLTKVAILDHQTFLFM